MIPLILGSRTEQTLGHACKQYVEQRYFLKVPKQWLFVSENNTTKNISKNSADEEMKKNGTGMAQWYLLAA